MLQENGTTFEYLTWDLLVTDHLKLYLSVWCISGFKCSYHDHKMMHDILCVHNVVCFFFLLLGYRAPCVLCDICATPLTGFSFRCTDVACSVDENEVFDLCYKDYNEGYHLDSIFNDHQMQCIMQNIFNLDQQRSV